VRLTESAVKTGALLPLGVGFVLLVLPFSTQLSLEYALPSAKLLSVLGGVTASVLLGLALVTLGLVLRKRVIVSRQSRNDRTAQEIMTALRANSDAAVPEFYLYLRAFETTGRLQVPLYLRLRKFSIGLFQLVTSDLESYVGSAVGSAVPLIAMGRPGESVGAGRVVASEEHWEGDISTLMRRATGILLIPSSRPGTLWEMDALKRNGLLRKVVFVMPPRTHGGLDTRERWEAARSILVGHGIEAPEHQERGLLFETDPDGKVCNVEPLLLNSARQVRKSLRRLLSDAAPKGGLYHAIAVAHKRARRATFRGWLETVRELSPLPLAAGALLLGSTATGFDPAESWGTVWDRSQTAGELAGYGIHNMRGRISTGVNRLDDARLRAYFVAWGDMLARLDQQTCAAIARGDVEPDAMQVALSYIPAREAGDFLNALLTAEAAEQENAEIPPLDSAAVALASNEFYASLSDEDRQRYVRIGEAGDQLSDEDRCWAGRTVFGRIGTLPEPHASVWARSVANEVVGQLRTASPPPAGDSAPPVR